MNHKDTTNEEKYKKNHNHKSCKGKHDNCIPSLKQFFGCSTLPTHSKCSQHKFIFMGFFIQVILNLNYFYFMIFDSFSLKTIYINQNWKQNQLPTYLQENTGSDDCKYWTNEVICTAVWRDQLVKIYQISIIIHFEET